MFSNHKPYQYLDPAARKIDENRGPELRALDREANRKFGAEANRLFGDEARRKYAPEIEALKRREARRAAKQEVDEVRQYADYIAACAGILATYASSGYGIPVSMFVGVVAALSTQFTLPSIFNKAEDLLADPARVKVETRLELRAVPF